jgi:tetratricopeptide (TPR) repeat protein
VVRANALNALGVVGMNTKAFEEAQRHLTEAQKVFKDIGNRRGAILALGNMGSVASMLGEPAKAKELCTEALTIALDIGDRRSSVSLLDLLGNIAYEVGDDAQAAHDYAASLKLAMEIGTIPAALMTLAGFAQLRARAGQAEPALELLGFALNHPACDDETHQRGDPVLADLRSKLPAEIVESALARGQTQTLEAMTTKLLGEK